MLAMYYSVSHYDKYEINCTISGLCRMIYVTCTPLGAFIINVYAYLEHF